MSTSPDIRGAAASSVTRRRVHLWPLWATVAGLLGFAGTIVFESRPAAEREAFEKGVEYTVISADVLGLDAFTSRLGWTAGVLSVVALLVFVGVWHRNVLRRVDSAAAAVVAAGVLASAAALTLGYGWKGALANYLGTESGYYDQEGLFIYYMLTDFGAYLPWLGVLVAAFAVAWMAFAERHVSRILGGVSVTFAVGLGAFMLISGVPGIPGTLMPAWLAILGVWLAVGRSRVMQPVVPALDPAFVRGTDR
ncbi:hypothetical protein [Microbacterium sp. No. 7]|uniref:hypothetical protein n=1 Tax=Microbacterium sp. No. 7 TaxID=1714373 RepID=UPI0006D0B632|nr:hypothetical protein [Microbacterium sp. No. 7]ALJ19223.1 hypothetical protein AOA12_04635 [Microbacterium sp. No. 7]